MLAEFFLERECNSALSSRRLIVATALRHIITPKASLGVLLWLDLGALVEDVLRNALAQSLIWRCEHIY